MDYLLPQTARTLVFMVWKKNSEGHLVRIYINPLVTNYIPISFFNIFIRLLIYTFASLLSLFYKW